LQKTIQNQIKELGKAIENYMQLFPNTLISVKGIGPVYCAGIIAEIVTSNALAIKLRSLSLPVWRGLNISPAGLKPLTPG
jgi:hypothetical protein